MTASLIIIFGLVVALAFALIQQADAERDRDRWRNRCERAERTLAVRDGELSRARLTIAALVVKADTDRTRQNESWGRVQEFAERGRR